MRLDTRDFPLLIWAAQIVQFDYHAPERFDVASQLLGATDALARELPDFFASASGTSLEVRVGEGTRSFEVPAGLELRQGAEILEQILVYVRDQKELKGEALHELEYAAVNGYMSPLDPHTILLTPKESADLGVKTRGRFGGVGIRVFAGQRRIVVDEVLPASPAEKAGMKSGDVILRIDGQATVNMQILEARELLRGLEGTEVKVQVRRGKKTLKLVVTRGVIQIQSVESTRLPNDVAYLRITTFQQDTGAKVGEALAALNEAAPLKGVMFDLRGNSGGLLTQATALLDHIVSEGELVIVRSATGRETQSAEAKVTLPLDVPVLALIDENSASAAEIVAGGIAALERGVVVGRASFGKGTVQMLKPSQPYGEELALKMTVAEYLVGGDTKIQGRGVQPDLNLLPARLQEIPGVASLFDEERFERARERAITASLPSSQHDDAVAQRDKGLTLRYLTRTWDLAEGEPPPMRDAEIRLAHELLLGLVGAGKRSAALEQLKTLHATLAAREDAALGEGMTAFWGDALRWGPIEGAQEGSLELSAVRLLEGPANAGEAFGVELTVKNTGDKAVERVHVISDCGQDELDGIEYVFGHLEAGESKTQTLNLVMMVWHANLHDVLRFDAHIGELAELPDASAEVTFDVKGAARPHLGFDIWIIDDPKSNGAPKRPSGDPRFETEPFVIKGNGDGRAQPGEQVLLAFAVRNSGEGMSASTLARVRNLSGKLALLEEGEVEFGAIAPGKVARAAIGVSVRPDADPGAALTFDVMVADRVLRERVDREVSIPLSDGANAWRTESKGKDAAAQILGPRVQFLGLDTVSASGALTLRGSATHPRRVEELTIWVLGPGVSLSDRKVAYVRQPAVAGAEAGALSFEQALELEPGPNRIRVIARDADGVEGRADAWVFVPPAADAQK